MKQCPALNGEWATEGYSYIVHVGPGLWCSFVLVEDGHWAHWGSETSREAAMREARKAGNRLRRLHHAAVPT